MKQKSGPGKAAGRPDAEGYSGHPKDRRIPPRLRIARLFAKCERSRIIVRSPPGRTNVTTISQRHQTRFNPGISLPVNESETRYGSARPPSGAHVEWHPTEA